MNHILDLLNYPPVVISRRHRKQYLDNMKEADEAIKNSIKDSDPEKYNSLVNFIYSEYKLSYWDIFLI